MNKQGQKRLDSFLRSGSSCTTSSAGNLSTSTQEPSTSEFGGNDCIIDSEDPEKDEVQSLSSEDSASIDSQSSDDDLSVEIIDDCEEPPEKKQKSVKTAKPRNSGFDERRKKEFKWLGTTVEQGKVGMICKVCQKHSFVPRSGKKVWISEPCFQIRRDKIKQHEKSSLHRQSMLADADRSSSVLP
jgi:hypothetical protein